MVGQNSNTAIRIFSIPVEDFDPLFVLRMCLRIKEELFIPMKIGSGESGWKRISFFLRRKIVYNRNTCRTAASMRRKLWTDHF
jgi:hypothetical protein